MNGTGKKIYKFCYLYNISVSLNYDSKIEYA